MNKPPKICPKCASEFYSRNTFQKFCSPNCYHQSAIGQKNSWGYKISRSLKGKPKSPEHIAKVADALKGRIKTNGEYCKSEKTCMVCRRKFTARHVLQKYCSHKCYYTTRSLLKELRCNRCLMKFKGLKYANYATKFCSSKCYKKSMSENRKGTDNPAYRNGAYTVSKKRSMTTTVHMNACKKYREEFRIKHGFLFCEICGVNANGTSRFEVHHIYYASLYPKHPNLHNTKNLILICIGCHNDLHGGILKNKFLELEKNRELKILFSSK